LFVIIETLNVTMSYTLGIPKWRQFCVGKAAITKSLGINI